MIHLVKINDNTASGKRLIEELRKNTMDVEFVNTMTNTNANEEYMTGEEFWKLSRTNIDNICKKHGLL
jgi:hypothetical protein